MSEYTIEKRGKTTYYNNLKDKDRKRHGEVLPGNTRIGQHAAVSPGHILIYGHRHGSTNPYFDYEYEFRVGDQAEYDSYNLQYIGTITKISPKTVTIEAFGRSHRLSIYDFSWRNNDKTVQEKRSENSEAMMYL